MPQSLAQLYIHLVFSTKNREPIIQINEREDLQAYIGGTLRELRSPSLAVSALCDHVHILYRHSKNLSPAKLVEEVKVASSKWIKTCGERYRTFHWQSGYGAFSVSASNVEAVRTYVLNQEAHHQQESFQDEFRRLLREYQIEYDEQYVWD